MKTKLPLHLLLLLPTLLTLSGTAHAQGTAIGYQGRLNDGGQPATGLYDFTFHIFDAAVGGSDVTNPLPLPLPHDAVQRQGMKRFARPKAGATPVFQVRGG